MTRWQARRARCRNRDNHHDDPTHGSGFTDRAVALSLSASLGTEAAQSQSRLRRRRAGPCSHGDSEPEAHWWQGHSMRQAARPGPMVP